jgi:molybdate transport system substrate-binding protein
MRRMSWVLLAIALLAMLAVPGVSVATGSGAAKGVSQPQLKVFAAASLNHAFPAMVPVFKKANPQYRSLKFVFNFQGTDTLVAQIEQGAPADVFAGASTKYGTKLYTEGLVNYPRSFCQNKLCVILPAANPAGITSLADVATKSTYIAVGSTAVPIGTYTGQVLDKMAASGAFGADYKKTVMSKAVTCLNVTQVVSLVMLGEVDAGFVYVSDPKYAGSQVKKLTIDDAYQSSPLPTYPIASVKSTQVPKAAQRFINFVMGRNGQKVLKQWGFLPKPVAATAAP